MPNAVILENVFFFFLNVSSMWVLYQSTLLDIITYVLAKPRPNEDKQYPVRIKDNNATESIFPISIQAMRPYYFPYGVGTVSFHPPELEQTFPAPYECTRYPLPRDEESLAVSTVATRVANNPRLKPLLVGVGKVVYWMWLFWFFVISWMG